LATSCACSSSTTVSQTPTTSSLHAAAQAQAVVAGCGEHCVAQLRVSLLALVCGERRPGRAAAV
jgi:hypothetical protein